jgi:hypothetical protein
MRLSELLRAKVVDTSGNDLGSVDDVLLVQDGPMLAPFGAALRVEGLVVGRGAVGARLGYHRGAVDGPWLLRVLFRALERRARYVRWEQVESWDGEVVRIAGRGEELGAPPS